MLMRAATLTLGQISDPVFRGVVIKSVLFTLALFVALTVVFYWAVPEVKVFESGWLQWANSALEVGGSLAFFAALVLTFSATATLIGGIFQALRGFPPLHRHYARAECAGLAVLFDRVIVSSTFCLYFLWLKRLSSVSRVF